MCSFALPDPNQGCKESGRHWRQCHHLHASCEAERVWNLWCSFEEANLHSLHARAPQLKVQPAGADIVLGETGLAHVKIQASCPRQFRGGLGFDGFSFEMGGRFRALLMLARATAAEQHVDPAQAGALRSSRLHSRRRACRSIRSTPARRQRQCHAGQHRILLWP